MIVMVYTPRYKVTRKYIDNDKKIATFEYSIRYEHPEFFVDVVYNGQLKQGVWFSAQEKTCKAYISKVINSLDKKFTRIS